MYDYNRYGDRLKFVSDEREIKIYDECYIPISSEDDYDMAVYLETGVREHEEIKKYILSLIEHICELDNITQKYNSVRFPHEQDFPYELVNIHIERLGDIRLEYWGCIENTQFNVGFKWVKNRFFLKSFGMIKDIPEDWDK